MTWRRASPLIVVLVVLAGLLGGLRPGRAGKGATGAGGGSVRPRAVLEARVTRVVDGDTVKVSLAGHADTVRYIGVDTPEDVKPGVPVECFSRRAAARNRRLVDRERVVLRLDANPRDKYGRLLAYVYRARDGLFVNAALVREGYARTDPFPDNTVHASLFAHLDARARARHTGLWAACGPGGTAAFPNL